MRRQSRAPLASRAATSRRHLGATLAAAAVMLASASAHGQEPARFERMIARDSARFVAHADPEVRGEAAWINAAEGGADFEVLRTLAQSGESAARQRAILALGHVRQPRAVEFLALQLQDITHRDEADAPLWAFALGSADPELAGTAVSTLLASFLQGSYGRQRETILGLLAGLRQRPTAGPIAGLLRLFQDDSNREPEVRRLLLQLLLQWGYRPAPRELSRLLERGDADERLATLQWLAHEPSDERATGERTTTALLSRIATTADRGSERAAALAALTRMGHLPALDLAAGSLRGEPVEVEQALRTMLDIGGARLYATLDAHIQREAEPLRLTALLRHYEAPLSLALADLCARLAADIHRPAALRVAAGLRLAGSDAARAAPLLRDLFRQRDLATPALLPIARVLVRSPAGPPALDRLVEGDLAAHPGHWQALLAAEHPEAQRQLLAALQAPKAATATVRAALTAFRRAQVTSRLVADAVSLPAVLRNVLRGEEAR
jgi:hypothetical protein